MQEEILDIVDENDEIIGQCERHQLYNKRATNRIVDVLIRDSKWKIALQRRSQTCSFMPGALATSAGGHVISWQTYKQAAYNELIEEIGIRCELKFVWKYYDDRKEINKKYYKNCRIRVDESHFFFTSVYEWTYDWKFSFDDGEVDKLEFFSKNEIRKMIDDWEYMMAGVVDILEKFYLR